MTSFNGGANAGATAGTWGPRAGTRGCRAPCAIPGRYPTLLVSGISPSPRPLLRGRALKRSTIACLQPLAGIAGKITLILTPLRSDE